MKTKQDKGKLGEEIAEKYLKSKGYQILEKNWRFSRYEIDIICREAEITVFVEIKTRMKTGYEVDVELVTKKQQNRIWKAAEAYMIKNDYKKEVRFDVIRILIDAQEEPTITHYEDAFFPGWA